LAISGCTGDSADGFRLEEATISDIHQAMEAGGLTTRGLVEMYLERIEAYDKRGPGLNSIITVNPLALERADELDASFRESGLSGPLHGIAVIVKDNMDTEGMPTTAGTMALAESYPPDDAFIIQRIRKAGGIVLAKANMAEFGWSGAETVGSALPGHTLNPYALNRAPGGSSGGPAVAVAANLATVGIGTDAQGSVRIPAAHACLVGLRPTMGLVSRDGIVPNHLSIGTAGPLTRTVRDAALLLDVIAGFDTTDSMTGRSQGRIPESYAGGLDAGLFRGARIGVLREEIDSTADPEVLQVFEEALAEISGLGAVVVDSVELRPFEGDEDFRWCSPFKAQFEGYLASLGDAAPVQSFDDIDDYHPYYFRRYRREWERDDEDPVCEVWTRSLDAIRAMVASVLIDNDLDALALPTLENPARLLGDRNTPEGRNTSWLSPLPGFPAITVPMGFVRDSLPVGLHLVGSAWSDQRLLQLAYAYEQATHLRRPPRSAPQLAPGRR